MCLSRLGRLENRCGKIKLLAGLDRKETGVPALAVLVGVRQTVHSEAENARKS